MVLACGAGEEIGLVYYKNRKYFQCLVAVNCGFVDHTRLDQISNKSPPSLQVLVWPAVYQQIDFAFQ